MDEVRSVRTLDLARYLGLWFEIGRLPLRHLRLLARQPAVSEDIEKSHLATAEEQGFDLSAWIRPAQSGRIVPF